MLAKFFIERPVLANVIALVTMLLGGVAMVNLPVAQDPPITPPTIQVTATYPGANAKTLVETVASRSSSRSTEWRTCSTCSRPDSDGRYTLTVTFKVGTDLDFAQVLVQNRVSAALAQLPQAVQAQGVVTKKKSTAILQIITLTSPTDEYDGLFLSNFATLQLHDKLVRLPGVSEVTVFGIGQYSMRIWLDPQMMAQRSLMPSDVINAIHQQNAWVAAGQVNMPPAKPGEDFQFTIDVKGDLSTVEQFENIIVNFNPANGGQITRIRDIGRVELGAQTYSQFFNMNGKAAGGIAIFQLPEANALDMAKACGSYGRTREGLSQRPGLHISVRHHGLRQASVNEVYHTLFEAGLLVLIVIVVFLQDWRATLVPATTVPVTIIGAFAAMAAMGFTINLLTLFAIVLAIGIVVDDAIVVVEGATQHLERGKTPKQASIDAMNELMGPIVGVTLVLMSVFIPPAFMPGITGQMYRQFALVIAATAFISAINAATLKPTQCALWLRQPSHNRRKNFFFRGFNSVYERLEKFYARLISRMVGRSGQMAVIGLLLVALAGWGLTRIPTGFIPTEDQGYAMVTVQLPDGASLKRTEQVMDRLAEICRENPAIERTIAIGGMSPLDNNASLANAGIIYLMLKDWSKRGKGEDLQSIYNDVSARLAKFQGAKTMVLVPPPIQGLGLSGGFQMQVELANGTYEFARLQAVADEIVSQAKASPMIRLALTPLRASAPQVSINVNRTRAQTLGVDVGDVNNTVQTYLGSSFVNLFTRFGHNYMVYAQADAPYRLDSDNLKNYYVRGQSGQMVPLSAVASIESVQGPSVITLYNLFPSATINGSANAGFSSGQALQTLEDIADKVLPTGMTYEWTAMSYQEKLVGNSTYFIFALAILLVYFVLAGQYESWITPGAVILAVPLALLGTAGALLALGVANNLYVQIGLVLLIALSAKNAILIVEMARERRAAGKSIVDATVEAARIRFRPILMTSFTFILGVLPLLLASGAGASARKSLGLTVATGMLTSTCLAVLFVPAFYVVLQHWAERKRSKEIVPSLTPTSPGPAS